MSKAKKTFTSVFLGTVAATLAFVGVFLWQQHCTYPGSPRLNREERKLRTPQVRNWDGNTTIEPQPTPDEYSGVVQKSVFSPKMRMVVPVGLEGTGHHTMNKALTEMCKLDTVVCPVTCDVSQALYHYIGTPKDESDYMVGLKKLHDAMEALALAADGLNNEISLAFSGNCRFSTMSFPSFGGPDKPLQYVDLKILAREAERVGIDLRLIYLGRSARDILISTTQHRHFGGTFSHEARILITNAAVIKSALREVDPSFVSCVALGEISDSAQAALVAGHAMPTPDAAGAFSQMLLVHSNDHASPSANSSAVHDQEGWNLMSNRLQEKLDLIEHDHCYRAQVDHRKLFTLL